QEILKKVLDGIINWNVLYLTGKEKKLDEEETFKIEAEKTRIGILSGMYLHKKVAEEAVIPDKKIKEYYEKLKGYFKGKELDDEIKSKIRVIILNKDFEKYSRAIINQVKKNHNFSIEKEKISSLVKNASPSEDNTIIGKVDDYTLTWGAFKKFLGRELTEKDKGNVVIMVRNFLEKRMLAEEAERIGMDKSDSFKKDMHHFEKNAIALAMRKKILKEVAPTEKELREYYKKNKKNYTIPESVDLNLMVVEKEEEAKKIRKILDENFKKFTDLAFEYSLIEDAKNNNGVYELLTKKKLKKIVGNTLTKKIFSSAVGKIEGPIKTEKGYSIYRVNAHREEKITPFDKVKDDILVNLQEEKVRERINKLRENYRIKTYLENVNFSRS
ncbi:MAG: peptidyl-prolyl cis-trans isomerase, partial [Candidatus Schekmanbacteria bacterium]